MKKILAVDDATDILKLLGIFLRGSYELVTAEGGQQALDYLETNDPPDLILLDVEMPGMNGIELQKRLDANDRLKNIPIIYITANNQNMDRLVHKHAYDFLNKPIAKQDLLYILDTFFKF